MEADGFQEPDDSVLPLSYLFCFFLDPRSPSNSNCQHSPNVSLPHCINCTVNSFFRASASESVTDYGSPGHILSILLWVLILASGVFGTLANFVIILILRKQKSAKAFEVLLSILACFDVVCSTMAALSATGMIIFLENWSREKPIVELIYVSYFTTALGRSGSTFMKVLITAERYIFIAHPESSGMWLGKTKTRFLAAAVLAFSILLNIPRYLSVQIYDLEQKPAYKEIPQLKVLHVTHVLKDAYLKDSLFSNLKDFAIQTDFWLPFPLLIIFTFMIYREIRKINTEKKEMQVTRRKDIREVKMFLPVIFVLFICNVWPVIHYQAMKITEKIYREEVLLTLLVVTVNSSLNLPIYVLKGCSFRKEARAFLYRITNRIG